MISEDKTIEIIKLLLHEDTQSLVVVSLNSYLVKVSGKNFLFYSNKKLKMVSYEDFRIFKNCD